MLKIGVLGTGHLGKIHLRLLKEIEAFELVGFYDLNKEVSEKVSEEIGIPFFENLDDLIDACDAIDIVTPTLSHYDCAVKALKKSKHVFIEKPITSTVEEAKDLIGLAEEARVQVQVGHVERFNPAFTAAQPYCDQPMFIECHRLAQFNPRGTDVSVVLDLMIHDIDIILSLVKSNIKKISASGVAVVSDTPDITNTRIEFDNGCVANLTASRISLKNMRKTRVFQRDAYISIDFLEKEAEIVRLSNVVGEPDPLAVTIDLGKDKGSKQIYFEKPSVEPNNAIKDELTAFAHAINTNTVPPVSIHDGYNALDVAHKIIEKLKMTNESIVI
ncbi:Gfo/Idh/MocA family protein [Acidiluteibacter ferrifornacis]|uniref:Gfo/Idh/MocA family oxidoreductase n=1 Tax=Acidiluteibacter ferrifornacis TaxID=2692424 RepID=A0A6N9NM29_9FLAO|nr:Gfo/Idh/MocA family oxidoreductase [Acidiluteibacter ferrifornacis]MBR9831193.1 Gfo/Idh/MocA family oxidoreductase [bacterium]NBG67013.1 Gfo/Idh/MocA family oxidoreductase [Acidiluteibacter ferrifornacis]